LVEIDAASVSRSATEPHRYLSAPIEIASPIVEGSRSGSETLSDRYRIWSRGGGRLVALITETEDAVVQVIGFSVLEGIMEATSAIAMFALMAFMVERLTNGVALLLGYFPWWRAHFEPPIGGDAALRASNDRNRRLALFVLGIAIAVPLAVGLNLDVLSQLQLPELPPPAAEIGTGLLAATGADPIREIIRSRSQWDVGERASGTTSTIHVEATLVAPPGATIAFPPRPGRGDATAQTERFALAEEPGAYTPTSDAEAASQPPRASGPD
jgi:hypothetical protein